MESNNHIDRLFKGALKNFESRPYTDVWGRIEESLNNSETPANRTKYTQYAAILFAFLSLSLISVPLARKSTNAFNGIAIEIPSINESSAFSVTENVSRSEDLFQASAIELEELPAVYQEEVPQINEPMLAFAEETPIAPVPVNTKTFSSNNEEFIFVPNSKEFADLENTELSIDRVFNTDIPMNALNANAFEMESGYEVVDREVDDSHVKIDLRGMYIGVNGSYNQTSILEHGNIFRGERPIQPSLKFGTSKGFTIGYNFNNHFGIQGDYIYNAYLGQNYVTSEEEIVVEKTLSLNYDQYVLTAKFKQARISEFTELPVVVNYIAGAQYGVLRDYRLPQEKRWETAESLFKEYDWAMVMGLDYEIYLQDNLFISLGGRGTISTDISRHNEPFDDFAKRNFVFGVRGGVNYVFR